MRSKLLGVDIAWIPFLRGPGFERKGPRVVVTFQLFAVNLWFGVLIFSRFPLPLPARLTNAQ